MTVRELVEVLLGLHGDLMVKLGDSENGDQECLTASVQEFDDTCNSEKFVLLTW